MSNDAKEAKDANNNNPPTDSPLQCLVEVENQKNSAAGQGQDVQGGPAVAGDVRKDGKCLIKKGEIASRYFAACAAKDDNCECAPPPAAEEEEDEDDCEEEEMEEEDEEEESCEDDQEEGVEELEEEEVEEEPPVVEEEAPPPPPPEDCPPPNPPVEVCPTPPPEECPPMNSPPRPPVEACPNCDPNLIPDFRKPTGKCTKMPKGVTECKCTPMSHFIIKVQTPFSKDNTETCETLLDKLCNTRRSMYPEPAELPPEEPQKCDTETKVVDFKEDEDCETKVTDFQEEPREDSGTEDTPPTEEVPPTNEEEPIDDCAAKSPEESKKLPKPPCPPCLKRAAEKKEPKCVQRNPLTITRPENKGKNRCYTCGEVQCTCNKELKDHLTTCGLTDIPPLSPLLQKSCIDQVSQPSPKAEPEKCPKEPEPPKEVAPPPPPPPQPKKKCKPKNTQPWQWEARPLVWDESVKPSCNSCQKPKPQPPCTPKSKDPCSTPEEPAAAEKAEKIEEPPCVEVVDEAVQVQEPEPQGPQPQPEPETEPAAEPSPAAAIEEELEDCLPEPAFGEEEMEDCEEPAEPPCEEPVKASITEICRKNLDTLCPSLDDEIPYTPPPPPPCMFCGAKTRGDTEDCYFCALTRKARDPFRYDYICPTALNIKGDPDQFNPRVEEEDKCDSKEFDMTPEGKPVYDGGMCMQRCMHFIWKSCPVKNSWGGDDGDECYNGFKRCDAQPEPETTCEGYQKYRGGMEMEEAQEFIWKNPRPPGTSWQWEAQD